MDDWISEDAEVAKHRAIRRQSDLERRKMDAEVLRVKAPVLWDEITKTFISSIDKFNSDNPMMKRVRHESGKYEFFITYPGGPRVGTYIDYKQETVECNVEQLGTTSERLWEEPPQYFRLRVSDNGLHYITERDNRRELRPLDFVKLILKKAERNTDDKPSFKGLIVRVYDNDGVVFRAESQMIETSRRVVSLECAQEALEAALVDLRDVLKSLKSGAIAQY